MIIKNSLLLTALFTVLAVYGKRSPDDTQKNLTGTWIADTAIIKKTLDGVSATRIYLAGDTAVTFAARPQKITVSADRIVFEYSGISESGTCSIEGNRLLAEFPTHVAEYRYSLTGQGKLELYCTVQYVIDGKHRAEEQCIFKCRAISETDN
ncbi:MAG: hypothetical protein LBK58_08890 [Prevotellaceae bacterium]|jgi:hypothetical protein|nr:hypothetical protein [Prevotellaceae bacterium]